MPIRRSIIRRQRVWHHQHYGSVTNPPLANKTTWPNGSAVTYGAVPRFRNEHVVVGWICHLRGTGHYGLYIASRIAIAKPGNFGEVPLPPKGKTYIDTINAEPGSFQYAKMVSERTPYYRVVDALLDAFAEQHDLVL